MLAVSRADGSTRAVVNNDQERTGTDTREDSSVVVRQVAVDRVGEILATFETSGSDAAMEEIFGEHHGSG